jgi:hypothetical protein
MAAACRHGRGLLAVLACWAGLSAGAEAGDIQAPWEPLPADARLVAEPTALTALLADHTVRGIYLQDGSRWREYSAADGRTVWEVDGCLHPGTWRVSGSAVCYVYPTWDSGRPQCFMVYQSAWCTSQPASPISSGSTRRAGAVADQQRARPHRRQSGSPAAGGRADLRRPCGVRIAASTVLTSPHSAARLSGIHSTASGPP